MKNDESLEGIFVILHLSKSPKGILVLSHQLLLIENEFDDVAVINWVKGRNFNWLNFARLKSKD